MTSYVHYSRQIKPCSLFFWRVKKWRMATKTNLFCGITDQHCMLSLYTQAYYPSPQDHHVHKTLIPGGAEKTASTHPPASFQEASMLRRESGVSIKLLVRPDVTHHFILKHFLHRLFYLLEEDLRNPTAQGVDSVQEFGLNGVEEWLEHVVLKGKLQRQKHHPVLIPTPFQFDSFFLFFFFINGTYHMLNGIYKLSQQRKGWGSALIINYDLAHL